MVQVVEHLPSKHKDQSSISSMGKKKVRGINLCKIVLLFLSINYEEMYINRLCIKIIFYLIQVYNLHIMPIHKDALSHI
jgi:hypothetical protein